MKHYDLLESWGHDKLVKHMKNGGQPEDFDSNAPDAEPKGFDRIRRELNAIKMREGGSTKVLKPLPQNNHFDNGGSASKKKDEFVAGPSYEFDSGDSEEAEFNRRLAKKIAEATGKEIKQLAVPRSAKDFTMNSFAATLAGGASDVANFGLKGIDLLREYDAERKAAKENKRGSAKPESVMGRPSIPRIQSVPPKVVEPYASEKPFMGSDQFRDAFERQGATSKGSQEQFPILGMIPEMVLNPVGPLSAIKAAPAIYKGAKTVVEEGLPRAAEMGANRVVSDVRRPFTPMTLPAEATAPDLGQNTSYGFRQGLNDRLLANPKLGTGKTKSREGQGTYVNTKGELELNPLQAIDVPRAGNIGEGPKANSALRQQVAQMGVDLNQEAMAGHRFLPMMTNNIKDASAMLIKTKEGLSKDQIADLARLLGNDMVVSHNPKLGGVVVFPFDPVIKGKIPQEFLDAQSAANKVLGKDAKIQYGKSDFEKDRLYMDRKQDPSVYSKAGATPMSAEQQALRQKLQGVEKFMFPESVSGIPGSVKAAPMGGLQPWSRGADYPTSVIGIGNGEKVEYQPVNFLTSAEGKRHPNYREAEKERAQMLDDYHRTFPSKAR